MADVANPIDVVRAYLADPHADYALLIDGEWGSGKTFFWREKIAPLVSSLRGINKESLTPLYISMNGIGDAASLHSALLLARHPFFQRKSVKITTSLVSGALNFFRKNPNFEFDFQSLMPLTNVVICIDDLERSLMPIAESLGYINHYVEHSGLKTIVLCNENAFTDEQRSDFLRTREKVFGKFVRYEPDAGVALDGFAQTYSTSKEFSTFLAASRSRILRLFDRSESANLRVLKRGVNNLYVALQPLDPKARHAEEESQAVLNSVLPLTFDFQLGRATKEEIENISSDQTSTLIAAVLNKDGEFDRKTNHLHRYFEYTDPTVPALPSIGAFVTRGVLDETALKSELAATYGTTDEFGEAVLKLFDNYFKLSDEDFAAHWHVVWKGVLDGRLTSLRSLFRFRYYVHEWTRLGVLPISEAEIDAKLRELITGMANNNHVRFDQGVADHISMTSAEDVGVTDFGKFLVDTNKSLLREDESRQCKEFCETLQRDPKQALIDLNDAYHGTPILNHCDPVSLGAIIGNLPNPARLGLRSAVIQRYSHDSGIALLKKEAIGAGILKDALAALAAKSPTPKRIGDAILNEVLVQLTQRLEASVDPASVEVHVGVSAERADVALPRPTPRPLTS